MKTNVDLKTGVGCTNIRCSTEHFLPNSLARSPWRQIFQRVLPRVKNWFNRRESRAQLGSIGVIVWINTHLQYRSSCVPVSWHVAFLSEDRFWPFPLFGLSREAVGEREREEELDIQNKNKRYIPLYKHNAHTYTEMWAISHVKTFKRRVSFIHTYST